jgi:hypothetical protein
MKLTLDEKGGSFSAIQRAQLCLVAKLCETSANNLKFAMTDHSNAVGQESRGATFLRR